MKLTALFITILLIVLSLFDLVQLSVFGIEGTVSKFMQVIGFEYPFLTFTFGFLCGHFFGYMKPTNIEKINKDLLNEKHT